MSEELKIQNNDPELEDWRSLDLSDEGNWQKAHAIVTAQFLADTDLPEWSGVAREFRPVKPHINGKKLFDEFIDEFTSDYIPNQLKDSSNISINDPKDAALNDIFDGRTRFIRQFTDRQKISNDDIETEVYVFLSVAFSELRRIVDYTIECKEQFPDYRSIEIISNFLQKFIGTMDISNDISNLSQKEKKKIFLSQRRSFTYENGLGFRNGLDKFRLRDKSNTCGATHNQIIKLVGVVVKSVYYYYPLLQKRYLDLQEKA